MYCFPSNKYNTDYQHFYLWNNITYVSLRLIHLENDKNYIEIFCQNFLIL